MRTKLLLAAFGMMMLTLAGCCCSDAGIDPPQPNQFENFAPPVPPPQP